MEDVDVIGKPRPLSRETRAAGNIRSASRCAANRRRISLCRPGEARHSLSISSASFRTSGLPTTRRVSARASASPGPGASTGRPRHGAHFPEIGKGAPVAYLDLLLSRADGLHSESPTVAFHSTSFEIAQAHCGIRHFYTVVIPASRRPFDDATVPRDAIGTHGTSGLPAAASVAAPVGPTPDGVRAGRAVHSSPSRRRGSGGAGVCPKRACQ